MFTTLPVFSLFDPIPKDHPYNGLLNLMNKKRACLWMGELDSNWSDEFLCQIFKEYGHNVTIKRINKYKVNNYCFIEFESYEDAHEVLISLNHQIIPNTMKFFRLNWASGIVHQQPNEFSLFVGDLPASCTDFQLYEHFKNVYNSAITAKVIFDPITNQSRGYGFVRFEDENDINMALIEMQSSEFMSRKIRVCLATPKKSFYYGKSIESQ
eukprot:NODE_82_length_22625_cov_0.476516.p10 type:complete len:211 gc:universal NODE_82_length_22625_cov_0.476516:13395-12763(-)